MYNIYVNVYVYIYIYKPNVCFKIMSLPELVLFIYTYIYV